MRQAFKSTTMVHLHKITFHLNYYWPIIIPIITHHMYKISITNLYELNTWIIDYNCNFKARPQPSP